jgi:hypothetical protein
LTEGPVKVPLIAVVAGAVVAGACVAGAVATVFVPELFVATGLAFFVAAAVAFVVAAAVAFDEVDDEADALAVVSAPAIGAPAMLIALVDPN